MTDYIFDISQHCVRVDLNEEISSFYFSLVMTILMTSNVQEENFYHE